MTGMSKQARSQLVMRAVLEAVAQRLLEGDELDIRIPEICEATGVNYGSVYHHFGSRQGVIDATYEMIFTEFLGSDLEDLRERTKRASTLEEYQAGVAPLMDFFGRGEERKRRRALRTRIVAAAAIRPELGRTIGEIQDQHTANLTEVLRMGQDRGWLRRDFDPHFLAVIFQGIYIGRSLDDVAASPIDEELWVNSMIQILMVLLESTPSN